MIIGIIGNIATGKTTLVNSCINNNRNVTVIEEVRSPFLEKYLCGEKVAFQNQIHYYLQCLKSSRLSREGKNVIQDRCIIDMHNVFSRMMLEDEHISENEWELLSEIKEHCLYLEKEYKFVTMNASVEVIMSRINNRNMLGDRYIESSQVEELNSKYKIITQNISKRDLLVLNTNNLSSKQCELQFKKWLTSLFS